MDVRKVKICKLTKDLRSRKHLQSILVDFDEKENKAMSVFFIKIMLENDVEI